MERPRINVLVIAADADRAARACSSLEGGGIVVSAVSGLSAALGRLAASHFDVVVDEAPLGPADHASVAQSGVPVVRVGGGAEITDAMHVGSLAEVREAVNRLCPRQRERAERPTQVPRAELGSSRALKLLLVDDSEVTLELIQTALREAGFDVRTAVSSAEALALVGTWRPDVAVVDLRRPDATGRSLCGALKEHGVALTLVASSLTEAELVKASREAAADGYVSKAKGVRAFVARVRDLVARAPTSRRADAAGGAG